MSSSVGCKASQVLLRSLTELQQRRLIRKDLTLWVEAMGLRTSVPPPPPQPPPPRVAEGKLDRLAIFMPPGSAKSTSASILLSPRYLSHDPRRPPRACAEHAGRLAHHRAGGPLRLGATARRLP